MAFVCGMTMRGESLRLKQGEEILKPFPFSFLKGLTLTNSTGMAQGRYFLNRRVFKATHALQVIRKLVKSEEGKQDASLNS